MALYKGKIPIISRDLNEGFLRGVPDDLGFGCVPRDFSIDPVAMKDSPSVMVLTNPSDYDAIFDQDDATESSLEHMYIRAAQKGEFEFLDQNGFPDCWCHSTAHAMMFDRLKQNLPFVKLNAVAIATLMRQTNGGWCGLSMKFARENGIPVVGTGPGQWPYQSRRGSDTPELRTSMATHKSVEDWYDLGRKEWDQKLAKGQLATCGFQNMPAPVDYNRASHSMLQVRWVRYGAGEWGSLILNSWQGFGYLGLAVLDASWFPDNAVALRASTASAA